MALLKYILKKMLMLLPVLVGISIIAFALGIMSPGDPVDQVLNPNGNESYTQAEYDAMAAKMGLDQPAVVQYFNWVTVWCTATWAAHFSRIKVSWTSSRSGSRSR